MLNFEILLPQAENPYRTCSALVPLKDENTLLAKATFTEGSVRGAIYFVSQYIYSFRNHIHIIN